MTGLGPIEGGGGNSTWCLQCAKPPPSLYPLAEHAALELGEYPQDLKHGPPSRCAGVEALLLQMEVDLLGVQFAEEAEQIDQAATEPIGGPVAVNQSPSPGSPRRGALMP